MAIKNPAVYRIKAIIGATAIKKFVDLTLQQPFGGHHLAEIHLDLNDVNETMGKDGVKNSVSLKELTQQWIGEKLTLTLQQGDTDTGGSFKEEKSQTFTGLISKIQLQKRDAVHNTIVVTAMSPTILLNSGAATQSFTEKSLSAIVKELLGIYGGQLKSAVSPEYSSTIPYITQYQEDSYHFIQRIADRYGEWCYYDGERFIFGKSAKTNSQTLELEYGTTLLEMDYYTQLVPATAKAIYYDYFTHQKYEALAKNEKVNGLQDYAQLVQGKSDTTFSHPTLDLSYQGHEKNDTLKKAVLFQKSESSNRMAVLKGTSSSVEVRLGGLVKIKDDVIINGVTQRTDDFGTFLITHVNHYIDSRGYYQNTFEAIPQDVPFAPVDYTISYPKAASQPAKVIEVGDEKNMGRVKVRFYWQKDNETTPWLRVANLMSSNEKGVYFVPEKEEIVFVDFEFDNPDLPFVRGSMYHGQNLPGNKLFQKENNLKGIITKGGNHIIIDDTGGKEEIRIYNKDNQNELIMSLQGESYINVKSKGKIKLEAETIELKAKTIQMTADQTWKVQTQQGSLKSQSTMDVEATSALTLKSQANVEMSGQVGVKVEGTKVDIEGKAQATLKAALVMIN